jgi:hypothetical protein
MPSIKGHNQLKVGQRKQKATVIGKHPTDEKIKGYCDW